MSTFTIYAFVVTGVYILYIGTMIVIDLFKKKGVKKDDAEVFSTADMNDDQPEQSTVIDETEDGFQIHQKNQDQSEAEKSQTAKKIPLTTEKPSEEHQPQAQEPLDDDAILAEEGMQSQAYYNSLKEVQGQMDSVIPTYQKSLRSDVMAAEMSKRIDKQTQIYHEIINI